MKPVPGTVVFSGLSSLKDCGISNSNIVLERGHYRHYAICLIGDQRYIKNSIIHLAKKTTIYFKTSLSPNLFYF